MAQGVVASWAARQMPAARTATTTERALWLAAVGVAEDGHAWYDLRTQILPLARRRLPDDARLRLATVLASTNNDLGTPRRGGFPWRNDVLREEDLPTTVTRRIPGAIRALEALAADVPIAGEVELRIGDLELRRRHWADALARFDAARRKTEDRLLQATADYLEGWVHEQLGDHDHAIVAYERALANFPSMRNLAIRLSALLFLRNERAKAYAILDRALNARPIPLDFITSLDRGDGRFVEDWLSTARRELAGTSGF
jgi:hypothetical protein